MGKSKTGVQGVKEIFTSAIRFLTVLFIIILVLASVRAFGAGSHTGESVLAAQVRALNNRVLQFHSQMQEASPNAVVAIRGQVARVIEERALALTTLIQQEPRTALSFAFSPELLADMATKFPHSAALLESHETLNGQLEHWIEDGTDLKTTRSYFLLKSGGRTLNVHFAGSVPVVKSGELLQATGVLLGPEMAVLKAKSVPQLVGVSSIFRPSIEASRLKASATGAVPWFALVLLLCWTVFVILRLSTGIRKVRANGSGISKQCAVCAMAFLVLVCSPLSSSAQTCSTTGLQNIAVLLVNFSDIAAKVDSATAYTDFFDTSTGRSLAGYWQEASYGQASAAGNVFGPFTVGPSTSYTCSVFQQLTNDVLSAAISGGVNFQNYTRIFVIFPGLSCGWQGLTIIGSVGAGCSTWTTSVGTLTASLSYVVDSYMITPYYPWTNARDGAVYLAAHEGGHQLGLPHSGTIDDRSTAVVEPPGTAGHITDQGDEFAVMGSNNLGHYQAQQKATMLGWMSSATNYQTVTTSGTYTLQPIEMSPPGLQALKIQRGTSPGYYLWLEYKQPLGQYDSILNNGPLFNSAYTGAMVTYEDPYYGGVGQIPGHTYLVDFNLADTYWATPDLNAGQTWTDPYSNVSISVISANSSGLTVSVNYGAMPCTSSAPSVSVSPLDPSIYPGQTANYSVTVANNDSSACSSSTFSLGSTAPSGWTTSLSSSSLTLSPGQSASVAMGKGAPSGTPASTYAVNLSASSTASSATGTANATVMTPSSLAVSVSVSGSSFTTPGTVPITASVTNGGTPASGASVTFTLTGPNGATATQTATTGTNGTATWNFKLSSKSLAGTYSVSAQSVLTSGSGGKKTSISASTQTATSNTATFTVQ